MRFVLLVAAGACLLGCATIREVTEGNPTPELAMYFAQIDLASEECEVSAKEPLGIRHTRETAAYYRKTYPELDPLFVTVRARYADAWAVADEEQRQNFCEGHARGFEELRHYTGANDARRAVRVFSPASPEALQRARRLSSSLRLGATLAASAASLSASRDAYNATKAGDFSTGVELASDAQRFNQVGATFASQPSGNSIPRGTCDARDQFSNFDAPIGAEVWLTYRTAIDVLECVQHP